MHALAATNEISFFYRSSMWCLFFVTTVYGHVGLKLAVSGREKTSEIFAGLLSPWGISSFAAWTISGLLWGFILAKEPLFTANSISSLRYIFVSLAAWYFLHEGLGKHELLGMLLIAVGIYVLARS